MSPEKIMQMQVSSLAMLLSHTDRCEILCEVLSNLMSCILSLQDFRMCVQDDSKTSPDFDSLLIFVPILIVVYAQDIIKTDLILMGVSEVSWRCLGHIQQQ